MIAFHKGLDSSVADIFGEVQRRVVDDYVRYAADQRKATLSICGDNRIVEWDILSARPCDKAPRRHRISSKKKLRRILRFEERSCSFQIGLHTSEYGLAP